MSITQGPSFKGNASIGSYLFVEVVAEASNGDFQVGLAATITSLIAGVTQDTVAQTGSAVDIAQLGQARLQVGASVTSGDLLGVQTVTGKGVTFSELTTTSMNARAIALQAGSTNAVIKVDLI